MNTPTSHATRAAVAVTGLRKAYGQKVVLEGVDLTIGEGEVFALLGPNGAGKTTIVRILSTLIPADAGTATVMGYDLRREAGAVRGVIGVTGQFSAVDELLTGEENLLLMGRLLHLPAAERRARASELLERFDLVGAAHQTPATYSGGMRRRLDIAMSLIGRPRLIFLDEPTTGLDPRSRRTMWQLIRDLVADGVTILLTTQYLEEADELAKRPLHEQIEASRAAIEGLHPGRGRELEKPMAVAWSRVPYSLGIAARYRSSDDSNYVLLNQPDGPFYFAGEHLSQIGAWQEGALLSAHRAINMIDKHRRTQRG